MGMGLYFYFFFSSKIVKSRSFLDFDSAIVFSMCQLVGMHIKTLRIAKKKFPGFNTHDIELLLVKFGAKLKNRFFRILNDTILFRMVGLPVNINFKLAKFACSDPVMVL